jgi:WD40 repeat protein
MSWHLWTIRIAAAFGLALAGAAALSAPVAAPEEKDPRPAEDVQRAQDDLRELRALVGDSRADPDELWKAWQAFRVRYAGTPEWRQAVEAMSKAPSPLDHLDGDQVPAEVRTPKFPKEAVVALGGNRGTHQGAVGFTAVSGDGRTIVSGSHGVHFWDPETLSERICVNDGSSGPMAVFPDGKAMVTCGKARDWSEIRVWDLSGDKPKKRAVLRGHGAMGVKGMALAADHKTLFTVEPEGEWADDPKSIHAWDIGSEKPKELPPLKFDKDAYDRNSAVDHVVCASRSMTLVDIGGPDKAPIRVWDLDKDTPQIRCYVPAIDPHQDPGRLAISPDGKILAARHPKESSVVVLWDVSGAEAKDIDRLDVAGSRALVFLPSGNVLAGATGRSGTLWLRPLNADGRKELGLKEGQASASFYLGFVPNSLAFTDDGKTVVIGGEDHLVHVWDLDKGKERFPPTGHRGRVSALAFSPDGKTLASGGAEAAVRLWDLTGAKPKEIAVLEGHTKAVGGLSFAPDGKTLASCGLGGADRTVRLWDLSGKEPRPKAAWEPHRFGTLSVAHSPAGGLLITTGTEGTEPGGDKWRAGVRLWDVTKDPPVERVALDFQDADDRGKLLAVQAADRAAFDDRGKTLGFLTGQQAIRLYDITDDGLKAGPVLRPFSRELGLNAWAVSPDGVTVATLGNGPPEKLPDDQGQLCLWRRDGDALKPLPDFKPLHWDGNHELVFSPDGRRVAGVEREGQLTVRDVPSGELVLAWQEAGAACVAFAPDGRHLAVGGSNGVVYILRLAPLAKKDAP